MFRFQLDYPQQNLSIFLIIDKARPKKSGPRMAAPLTIGQYALRR